jgi:hypothetical protein
LKNKVNKYFFVNQMFFHLFLTKYISKMKQVYGVLLITLSGILTFFVLVSVINMVFGEDLPKSNDSAYRTGYYVGGIVIPTLVILLAYYLYIKGKKAIRQFNCDKLANTNLEDLGTHQNEL